ncbi:cobalt-precorrin 5A hydrolase [Desulfonatronum parangueonense]
MSKPWTPAAPCTSSERLSAEGSEASTAVWALSAKGCDLGRALAQRLGAALFVPQKHLRRDSERSFQGFAQAFATQFHCFRRHVCIAATGIVVRCVAPVLNSKITDPAVVVLDQNGRYAISLLGGHLGGANALAEKIARMTNGEAVITTATDTEDLPALDLLARDLNLVPHPPQLLKTVVAAMLDRVAVQIWDPENHLWPSLRVSGHTAHFTPVDNPAQWEDEQPGIWISWRTDTPEGALQTLCLHPRCLVAGLGCHRDIKGEVILRFIEQVFALNGLALQSLAVLGTIRSRADEAGVREALDVLQVDAAFFSAEELAGVSTPHPSAVAHRLAGTASVCEAAALLLGKTTSLLVPKVKGHGLTVAVARKNCDN